MADIDFGAAAMSGDAKEIVQTVVSGAAGAATFEAAAAAAVAAGCGAAVCTVGIPVVLGLGAASVVSGVVGDIWDSIFG